MPIIENIREQRLLVECNSPCNTTILRVQKLNRDWCLVQDLHLINETLVPLHPVVPNPYTLTSQIPETAPWVTVLNLKDAFILHFLDYGLAYKNSQNMEGN